MKTISEVKQREREINRLLALSPMFLYAAIERMKEQKRRRFKPTSATKGTA